MTVFIIEDTVRYKVEAEDEEEALEKFLADENPTIEGIVDRSIFPIDDI
jgi:hypothetical protein